MLLLGSFLDPRWKIRPNIKVILNVALEGVRSVPAIGQHW